MTPYQKEVNAGWFSKLIDYIKEGGLWIWPDTGFTYTKKNGKLVGESAEADEALKEILPETNSIIN